MTDTNTPLKVLADSPHRSAILRLLRENTTPVTTAMLTERQSVDRSTVYRAIQHLSDIGWVRHTDERNTDLTIAGHLVYRAYETFCRQASDDAFLVLTRSSMRAQTLRYPADVGIGYVPSVDRLDLPALRFADGPLGVDAGQTTAWPASIALAASWNPDLAHQQGIALGHEATAKGLNVLLAPTLNIIRIPNSGRIFESYSEDPFLTSRFAVQTITGIQSQGVIATAKHFVANNHESNRTIVDVEISERAPRELYLPGFKAAVQELTLARS